ncbi:MAG: hypothetical protein HOC71_12020 [Candidatus Latescibacteria bacterium]|jgi:hypothetical protein|nr:hypothetical protein [Candidatus Latescibacterota bacterium]
MEKLWEKIKKSVDVDWGKIKKSVAEGVSTAAEKTEEYTKMGKAKLDVLGVKHKISKKFTELGGIVYDAAKDNKTKEVFQSPEVQVLIKSLNELEAELGEKESSFEELKNTSETEESNEKKE